MKNKPAKSVQSQLFMAGFTQPVRLCKVLFSHVSFIHQIFLFTFLLLLSGQACKNSLSELTGDQSYSVTANPANGSTLASVSQIEIQYPVVMNGMTVLSNYQLSGTGKNTLSIQSVTDQGGNRILLQLTGYARTGSLFLTLQNITDTKSRQLKDTVISYNLNIPGPTITATPASGSLIKTLSQLDISFSSPVNAGALQSSNYIVTNATGGNLAVTAVSSLTGNDYRLTFSGSPGNGNLHISFQNITDLGGSLPSTTTLSFTADTTAPTVTNVSPANGSSFNTLTQLDVTFSENVGNADNVSSYVLTGSGLGTLAKNTVTAQGNNVYRLALTGTPVTGSITLNLTGITDTAGNSLNFSGVTYSADTAAPVIQSSVPAGGSSVTSLTSVSITFSKAVSGATTASNYSVSGTGVGSLAVNSVSASGGNVYAVNFSGTPGTGSVNLTLGGITAESNGLALSGNSLTFTIDTGAPSITEHNPAAGSLLKQLTQLDVTYSEQMGNAASTGSYSVTNNGTGTLAVTGAVNLSANIFRISFSGSVGNGSFTVTSSATDAAGNSLVSGTMNFTADSTAPVISSSTPSANTSLNSLSQIDVTFSETVSGAQTAANYVLTGAGAVNLSVSGITHLGGNSYRAGISGTPQNGTITLTMNNITDSAGNPLSANTISFTGDFSGPTITGSPAHNSNVHELIQWDLTFSEPVLNALVSGNYSISGTGTGTLSLNGVSLVSGNTYRLTFTGTPVTGSIALNITNITDNFGNALATTSLTLNIDINPPTYTTTPAEASYINALSQVDFIFSEPMSGCTTASNYVLAGTGKGSLAITGAALVSGNTYRLSFSGTPGNGPVTITLGSGITDTGGTQPVNKIVNYTADIIAPTKSTSPLPYSPVGNSLSAVTFSYSETVNLASVTGNYIISGAGSGTLAVASVVNTSGNNYQVNLSGAPAQGVILFTINNVKDLAGNNLSGNTLTLVGGFTKYRKLTMNNSGIPSAFTDFTVPVILNSGRINYGIMKSAGEDIGFYDSETDGFALLPHQIEKWDTAGTSVVWVKVPNVASGSSTDYFYMYYGNSAGTDTQSATAVWHSDYRGVWHFSEAISGATQIRDSTANAHHGTSNSMNPPDRTTSKLGDGYSLNGTSKFISVADSANLRFSNNFTLEMWINWDGAPTGTAPLFEKGVSDTDNYSFFLKGVSSGRMATEFNDTGANLRPFQQGTATVSTSVWTHLAIVYNSASGGSIKFYKDGALQDTLVSGYTLQSALTHPLLIGKANNGGVDYFFKGIIDEARISRVARSNDFIAAQYRAMNDTFLAFGPEN